MKRYHENVPVRSIQGVFTAVVTPFRADERIDCDTWQTLIDLLVEAGVDGLMAGGSTGEFYALNLEERTMAVRFCRQAAARRVPVCANVGCITTRDTIQLALAAQSDGLDMVAVVTPWYTRVSQDELAEHYIDICRAVQLPVLAYNFPQHGGTELLPETLSRIAARCENLVGIKDSGGKLEQAIAYRDAVKGREFTVMVGPENLLLPCLANGGAGVVSGCSNIAPKLFVNLYRAFREGNLGEAARLQTLVSELADTVGLHTFPSIIKEAMAQCGFSAGPCRRPVGPVPPQAREKVAQVLAKLQKEGLLPDRARVAVR